MVRVWDTCIIVGNKGWGGRQDRGRKGKDLLGREGRQGGERGGAIKRGYLGCARNLGTGVRGGSVGNIRGGRQVQQPCLGNAREDRGGRGWGLGGGEGGGGGRQMWILGCISIYTYNALHHF